jgi:hypothetical protein
MSSSMSRKTENSSLGATGQKLSKLLGRCPSCARGLEGHRLARIGVVELGEKGANHVTHFFEAIVEKRWIDVGRFQEWDSNKDVVICYVLACPSNQLSVIALKSPVELLEPDRLLYVQSLDEVEGNKMHAAVPEADWMSSF